MNRGREADNIGKDGEWAKTVIEEERKTRGGILFFPSPSIPIILYPLPLVLYSYMLPLCSSRPL